jgi:hypothetical protein
MQAMPAPMYFAAIGSMEETPSLRLNVLRLTVCQ